MATETTEMTKQQLQKIRSKAAEADQKARKLYTQQVSNPWELAKLSSEVKKNDLWKYMPTTYDKWETWAQDVGMKRSTAFQRERIFGACSPFVPWKELTRITFENAEWLSKLPEADRKNPDIWKKAQTMKEDDFMKEVQERQRANGQEVSDGRVSLKIRCYANQSEFIQGVIKQFAEEKGLGDDYGRSLELICAEILTTLQGGSSFVEKIRQTILTAGFEASHLKGTIDKLRGVFVDDRKSADEQLIAAANAVNEFEDGLAKVVQVLADGTKNMGVKPGDKQASIPATGGTNGQGSIKSAVESQHNRNVASQSPNAGKRTGSNDKAGGVATGPTLVH